MSVFSYPLCTFVCCFSLTIRAIIHRSLWVKMLERRQAVFQGWLDTLGPGLVGKQITLIRAGGKWHAMQKTWILKKQSVHVNCWWQVLLLSSTFFWEFVPVVQAGIDRIIWFCIGINKSLACTKNQRSIPVTEMAYSRASSKTSGINWESHCTKTASDCVLGPSAVASSQQGFTKAQASLWSAPHGCSGVLVLRCPWETLTWSPLPRHLISQTLQEQAFFWNLHLCWKKSAITSKVTEHHTLPALALFPKKMALKKDLTFSLSWKQV